MNPPFHRSQGDVCSRRNHESFLRITRPLLASRIAPDSAIWRRSNNQLLRPMPSASELAPDGGRSGPGSVLTSLEGEGVLADQCARLELPVEIDVAVPIRRFRVRNLLTLSGGAVIASQWIKGRTCHWRPAGRNWPGPNLKSSINAWRSALPALFKERTWESLQMHELLRSDNGSRLPTAQPSRARGRTGSLAAQSASTVAPSKQPRLAPGRKNQSRSPPDVALIEADGQTAARRHIAGRAPASSL